MSSIKGLLATNSFLRTAKFVEHYEWLKDAAARRGVGLGLIGNSDVRCGFFDGCQERLAGVLEGKSFLIYWDKDIRLGRQLEAACKKNGIFMCNSANAIAACDDKSETYQRIWEWNETAQKSRRIRLIPTIAAPMTYGGIGYTDLSFIDGIMEMFSFPIVVKECFGSFGRQVYAAKTKEELKGIAARLAGVPHIYQEMEKNSFGRDVRLQVVGGRVVAAMYRYSENGDFRANVTNGAKKKPYFPSDEECEIAVRAAKILGLDYCGVDMLFSETGKADILCEVNSNAHFKNLFDCTGVNVADEIIEYVLKMAGR